MTFDEKYGILFMFRQIHQNSMNVFVKCWNWLSKGKFSTPKRAAANETPTGKMCWRMKTKKKTWKNSQLPSNTEKVKRLASLMVANSLAKIINNIFMSSVCSNAFSFFFVVRENFHSANENIVVQSKCKRNRYFVKQVASITIFNFIRNQKRSINWQ